MDNHVADRCVILEGDNRLTAPKVCGEYISPVELNTCTMMAVYRFVSLNQGVADRVCLGLIPSSECSWATAVRALR